VALFSDRAEKLGHAEAENFGGGVTWGRSADKCATWHTGQFF
jgi:hypothetical protein